MTKHETKIKARATVILAMDEEAQAWIRFAQIEWVNRDRPCPARLSMERAMAEGSSVATRAAVDVFAAACEEETRAGIAAWIAAAPARMEAQSAAGAQPLHYMHTIGQLAAAASLADAIRNKADLKDQGT